MKGPSTAAPAGPCVVVIFGAAGDLTKRKLLPALCNLKRDGLLPEAFAVIGVSREDFSNETFRDGLKKDIKECATTPVGDELVAWLLKRASYVTGDFKDPETYARLKVALAKADQEFGAQGRVLFYLSTAPDFFAEIVRQLAVAGLTRQSEGAWRRVIIEKPFGRDLESAQSLNADIGKNLDEEQVYRIDHYLGKETVQNILVLRFGNSIFEPIWNRRYINHVQITVAETVGVENRAGYYESSGALRDMMPNHLFQLLAMIAMEPPTSFDAEAVRDEKAKVLRAVIPPKPEEVLSQVVRGQYGRGDIDGQEVSGYRQERNVAPGSSTETYVAMKLGLESWRWGGVPFYLRTGKRMAKRMSEIVIKFKRPPLLLFRGTGVGTLTRNHLILHVQPEEGVSLRFGAKQPGPHVSLGMVNMDFRYGDYFGSTPNTGYETLLYDCMVGDATLFHRADTAELGWGIVQPILDVWKALPPRSFPNYPAGSWGPEEASALLRKDYHRWHPGEE